MVGVVEEVLMDPLVMIDARLTRIEDKVDCLDGKITNLRIAGAKDGAKWGFVTAVAVATIAAMLR